jgi:ribosomal protein L32
LSKRKRRRRENKELNQMTKIQRKAKTGSFEMSKTWSLKIWAMARRNQVKQS